MDSALALPQATPRLKPLLLGLFTVLFISGLFWSRLLALPLLAVAFNLGLFLVFMVAVIHDAANRRLHRLVLLWVVAVAAFFVLSSFGTYQPKPGVSFITTILFTKIFMVGYLFTRLTPRDLDFAMGLLAGLHLVGIALSYLFHDLFVSLMTEVSFKLDTSRLIGFTLTANKAAAISVLLALYYWFIRKNRLLFALFVLALALTVSRSLIALFILYFLYATYLCGTSAKAIFASVTVAAAAAGFLLAFGNIDDTLQKVDNTVNGDLKYIRAAMLFGGVQLAAENLPIGTGGGTYGSSYSRGSGVYDQLNIGDWETVIDGTGIFDSGIGSILGEYGVAGMGLVLALLWALFRRAASLPAADVALLLFTVVFLSFFRTVVADFFYAVVVFTLLSFLKNIRERAALDAHLACP